VKFFGLTRPAMLKWWEYYVKMRLEEMKFRAKLAGAKFNETKSGRTMTDKEVAQRMVDPLYGWPNDIEYLNDASINECVEISRDLMEQYVTGKKVLNEDQLLTLWNEHTGRTAAAFGKMSLQNGRHTLTVSG
jgi:hypothetical protein